VRGRVMERGRGRVRVRVRVRGDRLWTAWASLVSLARPSGVSFILAIVSCSVSRSESGSGLQGSDVAAQESMPVESVCMAGQQSMHGCMLVCRVCLHGSDACWSGSMLARRALSPRQRRMLVCTCFVWQAWPRSQLRVLSSACVLCVSSACPLRVLCVSSACPLRVLCVSSLCHLRASSSLPSCGIVCGLTPRACSLTSWT
jgi:hypothetical protein